MKYYTLYDLMRYYDWMKIINQSLPKNPSYKLIYYPPHTGDRSYEIIKKDIETNDIGDVIV